MKKKNRFWSRLFLLLGLLAAGSVFAALDLLAGRSLAWASVIIVLWLALFRLWRRVRAQDSAAEARLERQRSNYESLISMFCGALGLSDSASSVHSQRVVQLASAVASQMGLREREVCAIQKAAIVHDIGKMGLPPKVLDKAGALTTGEWEKMKRHSQVGADLLEEITDLRDAAKIVRTHHERFDGAGYPRGLAGDKIPLGSRIFAVADAYVAMTSHRPYRVAMSHIRAMQEITRNSGAQFDPDVVIAFVAVEKRGLLAPQTANGGPEGVPAGTATAEAGALR